MKLHFTSGYHPKVMTNERTNQTLESTSKSIATTNKTLVRTPSLAEFAYNNTPVPLPALHLLCHKGYHPNLTVHPECDLLRTRL